MQINIILSKYSDIEVYTLFYGKGNTGSRLAKSIMREAFGLGGEALFPRPYIFSEEELKTLPLKIKIGISIGKNDEDLRKALENVREGYRNAFIKSVLKVKCMEKLSGMYFKNDISPLGQKFFEKKESSLNGITDIISAIAMSLQGLNLAQSQPIQVTQVTPSATPVAKEETPKAENIPEVKETPKEAEMPDFKVSEEVFIPHAKDDSFEGDPAILDILGVDFG